MNQMQNTLDLEAQIGKTYKLFKVQVTRSAHPKSNYRTCLETRSIDSAKRELAHLRKYYSSKRARVVVETYLINSHLAKKEILK